MNTCSFFKLPILLTFFFSVISFCSMLLMSSRALTNIDSFTFIVDIYFIDFLPNLLLVFLISSVIFFRYQIALCTLKNSVLVMVIALILYVVIWQLSSLILGPLRELIFSSLYYRVNRFFQILYDILFTVIRYLVIGIVLYYALMLLRNKFTPLAAKFELIKNSKQLAHIHLILFILLLLLVSAVIYQVFIFPAYGLSYPGFLYRLGDIVIFMISVLILYWVLKPSFTGQLQRIELAKLIKSVMVSYLLSALLCVISSFVLSFILAFIFSSLQFSRYQIMEYVFTTVLIVQIVMSYVVMRLVTRHYFANKASVIQ